MSPTTAQPIAQIQDVSLFEGGRMILEKISFGILPGQIVSVIGPNGAGKTSLVKVIVGLIPPTSGTVALLPKLTIGYMPQKLHIDPIFPLTVERFLALGQSKHQPAISYQEMGIEHIIKNPLHAISGGELQRVLLTRALSRQPGLLVLDEPAQGIDLIGQGELYNLIAQIRERTGCAILLVSHDLNVVMAQTDIVVCLNQHICCSGPPENVSRDPAFTAMFGHVTQNLAFYMHRHDHHHGVHGQVLEEDSHDE